MLDSDHDKRPEKAAKPLVQSSRTAATKAGPAPYASAAKRQNYQLRHTVKSYSRALHDIAENAVCCAAYPDDADCLRQMHTDLCTLNKWVQKSLACLPPARGGLGLLPTDTIPIAALPPPSPSVMPRAAVPPPQKTPSPQSSAHNDDSPLAKGAHRPRLSKTPPAVPTPKPTAPTATMTPSPSSTQPSLPAPVPLLPPTPHNAPHLEKPRATRLSVRYHSVPSPHHRPRPETIVRSINTHFKRDVLAAVSYSRDDQLVLHTKLPYTAQDLLADTKALRCALDTTLFPTASEKPSPVFDAGDPWHKVVLHGVPLPVWQSGTTMDRQLQTLASAIRSSGNFTSNCIQLLRPLCPRAEQDRIFQASTDTSLRQMSILVCLSDSAAASQLLHQGTIIQSAYCRATRYRPRPRRDVAASVQGTSPEPSTGIATTCVYPHQKLDEVLTPSMCRSRSETLKALI
ncbi:hypothetical protein AURDEDRAFT_171459 [Auricularia subglabra TFB-10046 SS5]|nr:hypothetical protein AURDEDRAFT_171459 [Auricularia subglabra TFB-10046 SS5]